MCPVNLMPLIPSHKMTIPLQKILIDAVTDELSNCCSSYTTTERIFSKGRRGVSGRTCHGGLAETCSYTHRRPPSLKCREGRFQIDFLNAIKLKASRPCHKIYSPFRPRGWSLDNLRVNLTARRHGAGRTPGVSGRRANAR